MISTTELKNFAFTIQIPAFKKVQYQGLYIAYRDLTETDQESFLYGLVRNAIADFDNQHFEIKFEKHKDGRKHCHGTLYQLTNNEIEEFINSISFCVGIKSPKQKQELVYCIPILCSYVWDTYINKEKDEDNRKDFSKYLFGKINK